MEEYDVSKLKLLVADIDGTIVDSQRMITDHARDVIARLVRCGIGFGLASGRAVDDLLLFRERWGLTVDFTILIGINGSQMYDGYKHEKEDFYYLNRESLKQIMLMMEPMDANPYLILDSNRVLVGRMDDAVRASQSRIRRDLRIAKDPSEFWQEDAVKLMFRVPPERMPEVKKWVKEHPSPYYNGFQTDVGNIEFSDPRITKAYPLDVFCERYDIGMDEVAYFGDHDNDIPPLEKVGMSVCMINGTEETKAAAKYLTEKSNQEDGFADYVENHILNVRENRK